MGKRWVEVPPDQGSSGIEGSSGYWMWWFHSRCGWTWLDMVGPLGCCFVVSKWFKWWVFLQPFGYPLETQLAFIMLLPWPWPQIGGKSPCSDKIHRHFWISHLFMVERWLNHAESICLLLNLAGALDSSSYFWWWIHGLQCLKMLEEHAQIMSNSFIFLYFLNRRFLKISHWSIHHDRGKDFP